MNPDKLNPTLPQAPPSPVEADDLEPTKEELMEDLRDAIAGKEGIPAREGIKAIRRRIYGHAEYS